MSGKQETSLAAMRFSRLQSNGLPLTNEGDTAIDAGAWVACDPVSVDLAFEYDTGTETVQKDGNSRLCFARKRPNNLKNATIKFELCSNDPRQMELILSGAGQMIGGGPTPTGFALQNASCGAQSRNGVFVEWWTENYLCNAIDPTNHYTRHFTPVVIADYDGGTWDETRHAFAFTGICNAGVINATSQDAGGGPFNDITGFPIDLAFLYGYQIEAGDPVGDLDCTVDYTQLPAQVGG